MRFCVVLLVLIVGCRGPSGAGKLVRVSGRVTVGSQPLTRGTVSFRPDASRGNNTLHEPYGEIDAQGIYRLFTAGNPGAPLGWYKVLVVSMDDVDPDNPYALRKSFINPRYGQLETSGLALEVLEQPADGAYDLPLAN
jgi:hypothetical protein